MDNVYDYDKNILRMSTKEGISFNLKLRSPIMQVTGASGVVHLMCNDIQR